VKSTLIRKKADKDDHRIIHLTLSKEGFNQSDVAHSVLANKVGNIFSQMSEEDLNEVVRIFTNFLRKIDK